MPAVATIILSAVTLALLQGEVDDCRSLSAFHTPAVEACTVSSAEVENTRKEREGKLQAASTHAHWHQLV